MRPYYPEVPEQAEQAHAEPGGLESRIGSARPLEAGAPKQMTDTPFHQQDPTKPDCLLESARMAEHRQTGQDPGLEAYKQPAIEKGLYDLNSGTDVNGLVDVINDRPSLQAELTNAEGPQDIKDALDGGQSVIAGVDACEFYKGQANLEPNSGGHAVVMTGADEAPDGSWQFRVNDPNETAPNIPVDGNRFLPAWNRVDRPMITVQRAGGF